MITYGSTTLTSYNTITKIEVYYYKSTSSTDLAGGSWSTTKPTWENGKYIWQKIRTTYEGKLANGQFYSESDPVNITGQQGATGTAAYSYKLNASDTTITLSKTGVYSTNKITFSATYKQGTNPIALYNGGFVIQYSINGAEWITDYTSLENESSTIYTIPENILIVKCLLYQTKDCDELLDIVTVPIIKDGIDGTGVTNSFPIYLVSDKDKGITLDNHGWTRFKPSLDAENKYLWIDYISRYAEGNIKPQLIEKTGNKITFEYHGERSPFESIIIDITPIQSGSGTPSSGNKRHISGWTSIDIGQADINLMPYEEGKYMLDLPEDIGTLDNQTLNLKNTMFTIQGDTLIITKGDLGTHIAFPEEVGTIYGGKYNVTTGVLMVTHGYIDKYNNEPLPSTWISDRDVYVKGTKPSVGAQVVFELNEPLVYELMPQEIMIFEHSNSIYASTGDISISYYDYQTTTSPYIDYALVSAFDASTAALEEATQLKQDFQELQEDIQTQLDQKVETWCQINDPALSWTTTELKQQHNGDLWYYIGESNMSYKNNTTYKYVASTGKWMPYAISADLFDKIDTKTTIYYGQTTDTFSNVEAGDYLVDSTDGSSYRWDGSKWVKVTDYQTTITNAIDNIQIGGKNLLLKDPRDFDATAYNAYKLNLTEPLIAGQTYTIQLWNVDVYNSKKTESQLGINVYYCGGTITFGHWTGTQYFTDGHADHLTLTFTPTETNVTHSSVTNTTGAKYISLYNSVPYVEDAVESLTIEKWQLEKGNIATDWTPAIEDVDASIATAQTTADTAMDRATAIYGTCSTPTGTVAKAVTCPNFVLFDGARIQVTFTNTNTASAPTLNVNNTGAKAIYINQTVTSSSNLLLWAAGSKMEFVYDGTGWVAQNVPYALYGTCSTGASTAAKAVTCNEAVICKGTTISVNMTNTNTAANATMNVGSTVAKDIYANGAKLTTNSRFNWRANTVQKFVFDGQVWRIDDDSVKALATAYITEIDNDGIMVHPENDTTSGWSIASAIQLFKSGISYIKLWIENNVAKIRIGREDKGHVLIDNDSVDIKNGENVLASFGESTYIGRNNGYHMLISPNDFIGISDSNAEYFKISGYVSTKTLSSNETITETTGYRTGRYFSYRLLNTPLDSSTVSVQEVFYDENYTELNARHFEQVYHYEAPSSDPDTTTWKWEENISEIPAGVGNRPQQQLIIDEELFDQENGLEIGVHFSEASVKYVVFRVTYKPANSTVAVVNPYYTFGYRKDDYNVGVYSFAEGANIIASGEHSHAEGEDTIASGQGSHAEGAVTTANGDYSHIEGYNGTANGDLSHVEGEACVANGSTSHAQGVSTIADSDAQMVLGRLNMPDSSNKYAVIVGNGDINRRSDAFRLTWDGDLLFFYQNNNPSQGTLDYDLKQAIDALNWGGDIIVG